MNQNEFPSNEPQPETSEGRRHLKLSWAALGILTLALGVLYASPRGGPAGPPKTPGQTWLTSLRAARETASTAGEPILAMYSASWCPPCKYMKANVLPAPEVKAELSDFVLAYIDIDEHQDDARDAEIQGVPTFVMYGPDGREWGRQVGGMQYPSEFIAKLREIRRKGAPSGQ